MALYIDFRDQITPKYKIIYDNIFKKYNVWPIVQDFNTLYPYIASSGGFFTYDDHIVEYQVMGIYHAHVPIYEKELKEPIDLAAPEPLNGESIPFLHYPCRIVAIRLRRKPPVPNPSSPYEQFDSREVFAWKPEILLNKIEVFRCDISGYKTLQGNCISIAGNVSADLINFDTTTFYGKPPLRLSSEFLPVGYYKIKITDGTHEAFSEDAYITNGGTYDSYRKAKNGFDFSFIVDCSTVDLDNAICVFEGAVLDKIGGLEICNNELEIPLESNNFFHMSPDGFGMGFGGPPIHGNFSRPWLDVHWPAYFSNKCVAKELDVGGVDMTLDEETINLWSEILGGGGSKT